MHDSTDKKFENYGKIDPIIWKKKTWKFVTSHEFIKNQGILWFKRTFKIAWERASRIFDSMKAGLGHRKGKRHASIKTFRGVVHARSPEGAADEDERRASAKIRFLRGRRSLQSSALPTYVHATLTLSISPWTSIQICRLFNANIWTLYFKYTFTRVDSQLVCFFIWYRPQNIDSIFVAFTVALFDYIISSGQILRCSNSNQVLSPSYISWIWLLRLVL